MSSYANRAASRPWLNVFMAICLVFTMSPTLRVANAYAGEADGAEASLQAAAAADADGASEGAEGVVGEGLPFAEPAAEAGEPPVATGTLATEQAAEGPSGTDGGEASADAAVEESGDSTPGTPTEGAEGVQVGESSQTAGADAAAGSTVVPESEPAAGPETDATSNDAAEPAGADAARDTEPADAPEPAMHAAASGNVRAPEGGITANADHEIETFEVELVSGAVKDAAGNYVWNAPTSASDHRFTFRVNYAVSGLKELPAGAVTMRIPASILRDRDRNLDDYFEMSLPREDEAAADSKYAYRVVSVDPDGPDGPLPAQDFIEVFNLQEIPAGDNGYFEVSYLTADLTYEYRDYDAADPAASASDDFTATMAVKSGADTLQAITDEIPVYIDTHAQIVSTEKRFPNLYRQWDSSWGTEPEPAAGHTADEYNYLVWEIRTDVAYATQPYNFTLADSLIADQTTPEIEAEFVGYRLQGESTFSDKNTATDLRRDGVRYDFVLTRHLKTDFFHEAEYVYKIGNRIDATVDPVDQVDPDTTAASTKRYEWKYPQAFAGVGGHFQTWKWGNSNWIYRYNYYWDIANYDLREMQEGAVDELGGFKYVVEAVGYPYPWTLAEGADATDPAAYGQVPVNYSVSDEDLWFFDQEKHLQNSQRILEAYEQGEESKLDADDYEFEYLTYNLNLRDAQYDDVDKVFRSTQASYTDEDVLVFYAKFGSSADDWHQVATHNLGTGATTLDEAYGTSIDPETRTLRFQPDCVAWRVDTSNAHYYSFFTITPYAKLKASDFVRQHIFEEEDGVTKKDIIGLRNTETFTVTDAKDALLFQGTREATDFARKNVRDSDIGKRVVATGNNPVKRQYAVTWKVDMTEQVTTNQGAKDYIRQDGGVFYDLMPKGSQLDLSSIQVESDEGYLPESAYESRVVDNYKGSGRTLLIVQVKDQGLWYSLYYNTVHSWDSIKDFGPDVLNPVAYETGNASIANGYPDNGGKAVLDDGDEYNDRDALSAGNAVLFDDLDAATADARFIYTEEPHDIEAITAATAGLQKKVKADVDRDYSYETFTTKDGSYSYRLRYASDYTTKATNLVFFDSLENFVTSDGATSAWYGTLVQVDVSQLEAMGIEPVVYLSAVEGLDLDLPENHDLANAAVWAPASSFGDIAQAKAVAIDMRKAADGGDFVLGKGESVSAVLYLRAPAGMEGDAHDYYPEAYNNVYIADTVIDALGGQKDYYIHQDYTIVKYHLTSDVSLHKVSTEDEELAIGGITFRLYGTSLYGAPVDMKVTTDRRGNATFKDVEVGTYKLLEYEGLPDWLEDHTEHDVVVGLAGTVTVDGADATEVAWTVANAPRIHTDFEFLKRDSINATKPVPGARFKLSGTSDYGNDIIQYATSDSTGKVSFPNIELGTYQLKEISVEGDYIVNGTTFTVVVDENGNAALSGPQGGAVGLGEGAGDPDFAYRNVDGDYLVLDEPLHGFRIFKTGPKIMSYEPLQGVSFNLKGVSDYGTEYDIDVTSGNIGNVDFEGLEPGAYLLTETATVDGYELDGSERFVTVDKFGNVTIDGLDRNEDGSFQWVNKKQRDGKITVKKQWIDGSDNEKRPTPVITISTDIEILPSDIPAFGYVRAASQGGWSASESILYEANSAKPIVTFSRNTSLSEAQVLAQPGVKRIDEARSNPDARFKIYGWTDSAGNYYWWSDAPYVRLTTAAQRIFLPLKSCQELDLRDIDTSGMTSMSQLFYDLGELRQVNLSSFNTGNVTSMCQLFYNCKKLESLDLSTFDTRNLTNMQEMFRNCESLTTLDLGSFDTSKVTSTGMLFSGCSGLRSINLSSCRFTSLKSLYAMFYKCSSLTVVDLSSFDCTITNGYVAFTDCSNLRTIYASEKLVNNLSSDSMFAGCYRLVGGNGTTYRGSDTSYARIDTPTTRGYFTAKEYNPAAPAVRPAQLTRGSTIEGNGDESFTYVSSDDESEWVKNGDEWEYTFYVENDTLTYYAWEDNIAGYDESNLKGNPVLVVNGTATITNSAPGVPVTPSTPASYGSLSVSKFVDGTYSLRHVDPTTAYAHTANVKDDGSSSSDYANNLNTNEVRTFDGASRIHVDLYYSTESTSYDWLCVWEGNHPTYSANTDYASSKLGATTGKIAGHPSSTPRSYASAYHIEGDIEGDSVTFGFRSDGSVTNYGYYAVMTIYYDDVETVVAGEQAGGDAGDFSFTITLENSTLASGTHVVDGVVFRDGVAHIRLSDGQVKTFSGIPAGTVYSVTEDADPRYASSGYNASGTIRAARENAVAFNNETLPGPQTTSFALEKQVAGAFEDDGAAYAFDIAFEGLQGLASYRVLSADGAEVAPFTASADGSADVTVQLKAGERVVFDDIPVGARYRITEASGDYKASYKVADAAGLALIASTSGSNPGEFAALSTAWETADAGEDIAVTFTNRIDRVADLHLVKRVAGSGSTDAFKFDIAFSNLPEGSTFNSTAGCIVADEAGMATLTVLLADGDSVDFAGVPVGARYQVTEQESDAIASYEVTDAAGLGKVDMAMDANEVGHQALATAVETVNEGEDVTVAFTNLVYSDIAVAMPGIRKTVVDGAGNGAESDEVFAFQLTAATRTMPMPEGSSRGTKTVTVEGAGDADFGTITFDVPGTYLYTVHEVADGDNADMAYDATVYALVYKVEQLEDGIFEITASVGKDGEPSDELATGLPFTNVIATYVDVTGAKVWNDADDQDGLRPESITVRLLADGAEVDAAEVTADDGWAFAFEHLPQYADGAEIAYTIVEDEVEGYTAEISGDAESGFFIENVHEPEPGEPMTPQSPDDPDLDDDDPEEPAGPLEPQSPATPESDDDEPAAPTPDEPAKPTPDRTIPKTATPQTGDRLPVAGAVLACAAASALAAVAFVRLRRRDG